ncbi:MFS transporter, partial [Acinetobacter baumannii]|uniref:MFS transporter n=1 Tax=Acinetobacter baumannii TaxID=470 RepID=UPI0013D4401D
LLTCGGFALISFWLLSLLDASAWSLFIAQSIALVLWASLGAIWPAWMAEQISTGSRSVSIGVASSLGGAIFGGTAPYLNT